MTDQEQTIRFVCLHEELETSRDLIKSGFGHLQEIDTSNSFYALPHLLMASGLERLMKCYISLIYKCRKGVFPNKTMMRKLGHEKLLNEIQSHYFGGLQIPIVEEDLAFIRGDCELRESIRILSLFGKKGRYFNLDVVAGDDIELIDPKQEWKNHEMSVEDPVPYLNDQQRMYRDYYPKVHSRLIADLERLTRAIAMQFTLGGHNDPIGEIQSLSIVYKGFRNLRNSDFGTIDYRRSVNILKPDSDQWISYSDEEISMSKWPTRRVNKTEFFGDWPFRYDSVTIECQKGMFAIAYLNGFAFALNGACRSRFGYPDPHDAGVAILGRSIGPFIDIALDLVA